MFAYFEEVDRLQGTAITGNSYMAHACVISEAADEIQAVLAFLLVYFSW